MALKSGLLAESTWALDVLNILLYDDVSVQYFNLNHLPGLIEVLLDHFRQCLKDLFPEHFDNITIQTDVEKRARAKRLRRSSSGSSIEEEEVIPIKTLVGPLREPPDEENIKPGDYTWRTRLGLPVILDHEACDKEYLYDDKTWDTHVGFSSSRQDWNMGRGDKSSHIQTYFNTINTLQFQKKQYFGPHLEHIPSRSATPPPDGSCKHEIMSQMKDTNVPESQGCALKEKSENVPDIRVKSEPGQPKSPCSTVRENGCTNCIPPVHIKNEPVETIREKPLPVLNCQDNKSLILCDNKKTSDKMDSINAELEKDVHKSSPCLPNGDISECMDSSEEASRKSKSSSPLTVDKAVTIDKDVESDNKSNPVVEKSGNTCQERSEKCTADGSRLARESSLERKRGRMGSPLDGEDASLDRSPEMEEECQDEAERHAKRYLRFTDALDRNNAESALVERLKRSWEDGDEEAESHCRDASPLYLTSESQDQLARRCVCLSNILRSLSFLPGNDMHLSQHRGLVLLIGRLLLLHHRHPRRRNHAAPNADMDTSDDAMEPAESSEPTEPIESVSIEDDHIEDAKSEWWWDAVDALRENALVTLANMAGRLDLGHFPEHIVFSVYDGLLHWAVCRAACAQDPLPTVGSASLLSPMRLSLETLCKLSITDVNVDLLLATSPFGRLVQLFAVLVQLLASKQEQVLREFAVVLLSALVRGHSSTARAVALQPLAISLLLDFVETAESQAIQVAGTHGVDMLRENPEVMGTSLDMLQRAAVILLQLAKVPQNSLLFSRYQDRLLTLVVSQVLDQSVASILADVLFHCSQS